eukprot:GEMP01001853.1.p1 GENE.GEMP01001853.1~~GEMP01001853.1.p1  ORF type:complete len:355 (+),score=64.25 GEMP01001853.1:124-1188(+)
MNFSIGVSPPTNFPGGGKGELEARKEKVIREGTHEYLGPNNTALQYKNTFLHVGESNADGLRRIATCPTWQVPVEPETPAPEPQPQIITYLPTTSAGGNQLKRNSKPMIRPMKTGQASTPYESAHHKSVQASRTFPTPKQYPHSSSRRTSNSQLQESNEFHARGMRAPWDFQNDTRWGKSPTAYVSTSRVSATTYHAQQARADNSAINVRQQLRDNFILGNKWGKGGWGEKSGSWEEDRRLSSSHLSGNSKWDPIYQSASIGGKSRLDESYQRGSQNWFAEETRPEVPRTSWRADDGGHWGKAGITPQEKGKGDKGVGKGQNRKRSTQFKPSPKGPKAVYIDLSTLTGKKTRVL